MQIALNTKLARAASPTILAALLFFGGESAALSSPTLYVWEFQDTKEKEAPSWVVDLTEAFEESLSATKCCTLVQSRRLSRLVDQRIIRSTRDLSDEEKSTIRRKKATIVVFGEVTDDEESGQIKISVTAEGIDTDEIIAKRSVTLSRGLRLDIQSRSNAMARLAHELAALLNPEGVASDANSEPIGSSSTDRQHTSRNTTAEAPSVLSINFKDFNDGMRVETPHSGTNAVVRNGGLTSMSHRTRASVVFRGFSTMVPAKIQVGISPCADCWIEAWAGSRLVMESKLSQRKVLNKSETAKNQVWTYEILPDRTSAYRNGNFLGTIDKDAAGLAIDKLIIRGMTREQPISLNYVAEYSYLYAVRVISLH